MPKISSIEASLLGSINLCELRVLLVVMVVSMALIKVILKVSILREEDHLNEIRDRYCAALSYHSMAKGFQALFPFLSEGSRSLATP